MVIEVFAGTARVTASLRQCGLRNSFGVDKLRIRTCIAPLATVDLCTRQGEELLWQWLELPYVVGIWMAPPCGSASRARAIPLKKRFGKDGKRSIWGRHGPRPLRSDDCPNGLPNLTNSEMSRISISNQLYFLTAKLVRWATEHGVIFVVENPQFSLFWATTFWTEVAHLAMYSVFHTCQYGSIRKKKTMFAFNAVEFAAINAKCPGQNSKHKHAPWGIKGHTSTFATADESAYSMGLSKLIAICFIRALLRLGIQVPPDRLEDLQPWSLDALQRIKAQTGVQPKASRLPPLVRTYKTKIKLRGPIDVLPQFQVLQRAKQDVTFSSDPHQVLPKGARLLALDPVLLPSTTGGDGEHGQLDKAVNVNNVEKIFEVKGDFSDEKRSSDNQRTVAIQVWGLPWTPQEFLAKAVEAGHPSMFQSFLPVQLNQCVQFYLSTSASDRMQMRIDKLKFWMRRMLDLRSDERALHKSFHPDVEAVLHKKRILLWEEMLNSIGYRDMGVVREFRDGASLTGATEETGLWPRKFTPATLTPADLQESSQRQRSTLTYEQVVFFAEDIAFAVWDQTMDEVARGDIVGPIKLDDVPANCPLSKRFGIRQGGKIRCVDDFSASGVNATAQPLESPKPHTLDVLAGLLSALLQSGATSSKWMARSFDLKHAYRQCAVAPESQPFAYIVVGDPNQKCLHAFRMRALPFGSVKSVHAFLRVASSLWAILTQVFGVLCTNYFDDFVAVAESVEEKNVDHTVKTFFNLLGWVYAEDGPKAPPFSESVTALGVTIDVAALHEGKVTIANTESRSTEIYSTISDVLRNGALPKQDALKLRGRMQFVAGQLFGRIAKRCLACVTQHAYASESIALGPQTIDALRRYLNVLEKKVPRTLTKSFSTTWLLFTDASHEPGAATPFAGIGAVLVGPSGKKFRFFSERMSEMLLQKVNVTGRKTIIFECEFWAILCAMYIWKRFLSGCNVVVYTDNDGVRDSLIACHCSSENAMPILDACIRMESSLGWNVWYNRVPTESNVADDPSRLETSELQQCGCFHDNLQCEDLWLLLIENRGGDSPAASPPS